MIRVFVRTRTSYYVEDVKSAYFVGDRSKTGVILELEKEEEDWYFVPMSESEAVLCLEKLFSTGCCDFTKHEAMLLDEDFNLIDDDSGECFVFGSVGSKSTLDEVLKEAKERV